MTKAIALIALRPCRYPYHRTTAVQPGEIFTASASAARLLIAQNFAKRKPTEEESAPPVDDLLSETEVTVDDLLNDVDQGDLISQEDAE